MPFQKGCALPSSLRMPTSQDDIYSGLERCNLIMWVIKGNALKATKGMSPKDFVASYVEVSKRTGLPHLPLGGGEGLCLGGCMSVWLFLPTLTAKFFSPSDSL